MAENKKRGLLSWLGFGDEEPSQVTQNQETADVAVEKKKQ